MTEITPGNDQKLSRRIFNKILRIIEGPPVRDRIVVKAVEPSRRNRSTPCFLIGVYRSGTTLLRFVLDSHSQIAVPPETNFLHNLADMWKSDWTRKGLQGIGVDGDELIRRSRDFAYNIFDDYTMAKEKKRWVDKTPSYIEILDFIDLMFGKECQYIMLYRHGLDVANSMAKMYGEDNVGGPAKAYGDEYKGSPRVAYARYWAEQCEKMIAFEASHRDQCHRIFYEKFSKDPHGTLPQLFDFINEPWETDVLNFNRKQHDFGLQDSKILDSNTFQPNICTYSHWEHDEIIASKNIIIETMEKLEYEI